MNTLRNFAVLAFLSFATTLPVHVARAADGETPKIADQADGSDDVLKLLADRPEIVALARGGKDKAIVDALKEQISNAGGEKAITGALNEYLKEHPLKEGQDISDLARNAKEKALAKALEARLSKRP